MSIRSQKAGSQFGGTKGAFKPNPQSWMLAMILAGFPQDAQVIAEGIATISNETGGTFNPSAGKGTAHVGGWQEDSSFGSEADRLDPLKSTKAAFNRWKSDGETFRKGWTMWEQPNSGGRGAPDWERYKGIAEKGLSELKGAMPHDSVLEAAEGAVNSVANAEQFLEHALETILDFRALGNLMAQAAAWFLKLIAKAIWDYVIAPVVHWSERAVSFYWVNFFGSGTEQGSGFGYQLRNNAGAVTILFWSMGYAILWSNGGSATPVTAHESMLGQAIKGINGTVARRNLIKPSEVKKKTPKKPTPKQSKVTITQTGSFSVARKRPVSVTSTSTHTEGTHNVSSGKRLKPAPVPRPQQKPSSGEKQIILPAGVKAKAPASVQPGRAGVVPRASGITGTNTSTNDSREKRHTT